MKLSRISTWFVLTAGLLVISACSPVQNLPTQPEQTAVANTAVQEPSPEKQPAASADQAEPAIRGVMVFNKEAGEFQGYALDKTLLYSSPAPGLEYASDQGVEVVERAVYFMVDTDKRVFRSSPQGVMKVDLPTDRFFTGFAVSPDEQWIAWSYLVGEGDVHSTLWIGKLNLGEDLVMVEDAKQIVRYDMGQAGGNPLLEAFNLNAVRWTEDGQLLFERGLTGIGGYILYGGRNSLYSYDPASQEIRTIVPAEEMHGLCLDSYQPDLEQVAFHCNKEGQVIVLRSLVDGSEKTLPKMAVQGHAGSVHYSPSGDWIAYGVAEGNMENENGMVVVAPADLSALPEPIARVQKSYPIVLGWVDEQNILFGQAAWPEMSIWTISRGGGEPAKVADGMFVGLIQ